MVPTAIRQPESRRALAAKDGLVRKRYQKRRDLTEIIANKVTNLTNWWTELTLCVHLVVVREEADLMMGKGLFSIHCFYSFGFISIYLYLYIYNIVIKVDMLYCWLAGDQQEVCVYLRAKSRFLKQLRHILSWYSMSKVVLYKILS